MAIARMDRWDPRSTATFTQQADWPLDSPVAPTVGGGREASRVVWRRYSVGCEPHIAFAHVAVSGSKVRDGPPTQSLLPATRTWPICSYSFMRPV